MAMGSGSIPARAPQAPTTVERPNKGGAGRRGVNSRAAATSARNAGIGGPIKAAPGYGRGRK